MPTLVRDPQLFRPAPRQAFVPTAALVLEIVSPDDETWEKLEFDARHQVDELLIVDPQESRVHWLARQPDGQYLAVERSALIEHGPVELAGLIDWPS